MGLYRLRHRVPAGGSPGLSRVSMPTLILSPRYSDDSITLRRAAIALGWDVMRLASWGCPGGLLA
jgi:hypothetical protein